MLNPIWNTWHFFALYANIDGYRSVWRTDSEDLLDRYILAKTRELVEGVGAALDRYEIAEACAEVSAFLDALDQLVRAPARRDRFWAGAENRDAYDTLYTVLHTITRVCAPLLPYLCEDVYQGLTGGAVGAPRRLARPPTPCPRTTNWWPRWTGCARSAPQRCRCARRTVCGCGCRWRFSPWRAGCRSDRGLPRADR